MRRSVAHVGASGLIVFVSLTAAGCGSGAEVGGAGTPTASAPVVVPSDAPSSTVPTTSAPTPLPTLTPKAATWGVSGTGIGPLVLGRPWKDLSGDAAVVGLDGDLASCPTAFLMSADYGFAVTFGPGTGPDAAVTAVGATVFQGQGSKTPPVLGQAGVTFGSSSAAVEAAYPGGTWSAPAFNPDIERIYVVDTGPMTFGFTGDRVADIVVGGRDTLYEYCG